MSDDAVSGKRKADFWTSLVIIAVAIAMLMKALTFPLRGTYAGVENVWYVSPALLPIIVAACLIALGTVLLYRAARAGGARAALADARAFDIVRFCRASRDFWFVGGLIAVYVYVYVPRIDFIVATTFFLLTFAGSYHVDRRGATRALMTAFFGTGTVVAGMAIAGLTPGVHTFNAYLLDCAIWVVALATGTVVYGGVQGNVEARRQFWRCVWISLVTPLLLAVFFKYALLVPLPREGASVAVIDWVFYTLPDAF